MQLTLTQPHDDPGVWMMAKALASQAACDEHVVEPHVTRAAAVPDHLLREPSDLRLIDRA